MEEFDFIEQQSFEQRVEQPSSSSSSPGPIIGFVCLVVAAIIYFGGGHSVQLPDMPKVASVAQQTSNTTYSNSNATGKHSVYGRMAVDAAIANGIPVDYFVNQMYQESGLNPNVRNGTSGEIGIAQILPSTAAGLGINPYDPHSALYGAAGIMSRHYKHFGDYAMALSAYNAGSGATQSAINRCGQAWESCVPVSTQSYIRIAMQRG